MDQQLKEKQITIIIIKYGIIQVSNIIVAEVEHWNWLFTKSNELMLKQSIINKQPQKILMSIIRFGYVFDGRKKIFQDYKCKNASSHWMMGIF
jgi:hypothetical protein